MADILLVVDDQLGKLNYLLKTLERMGFQIETAENVQDGIAALATLKAAGTPPVAILSDTQMPESSRDSRVNDAGGLIFLATLRESGDRTPFILSSTRERGFIDEQIETRGFDAGMLSKANLAGFAEKTALGEIIDLINDLGDAAKAPAAPKTPLEHATRPAGAAVRKP